MTYNYFIAGRYRNKVNILNLAQKIREKGKTAYCFVDSEASLKHVGSLQDDGEEAMRIFESREKWRQDPEVRHIFETDLEAEKASEHFILLLPAGKSAHIEAGIAFGLGKKCIVIGEQKEAESLYLIFDEHYYTSKDFLRTL